LEHIADQEINGVDCEIILVDNASSDNTVDAAKAAWSELYNNKIAFSIVPEKNPGVAHARKRGVIEANYEFLIFCDDDNWLDKTYVDNVYKLFKANKEVAILSGSGVAEFENRNLKPLWFDTFQQSYAIGNGIGKTAGMAIRKSVLKKIMDETPLFLQGRKKNQLSAGEDGEICCRVRLEGYQILAAPQLAFKHFLPEERLTWSYLKKLHIGFAHTFTIINLYEKVLREPGKKISDVYWLKMGFYYLGITIKYFPKHYRLKKRGEGNIGEIHHIMWKTIAADYFRINFGLKPIHKKILSIRNHTPHEL
jgi:glycosyltransferase involved in cell wall biosynthesis